MKTEVLPPRNIFIQVYIFIVLSFWNLTFSKWLRNWGHFSVRLTTDLYSAVFYENSAKKIVVRWHPSTYFAIHFVRDPTQIT